MLWLAQCADGGGTHGFELVMRHGDDDGVIRAGLGLLHGGDAIFVLGLGGVGPGVEHVGIHVVLGQFFDDVDHAGVAQVGAVFFEGQAHDEDACALHGQAALGHGFDELGDHVGAHAVIQAAARQYDLRVVANGFGLVRKVIRVYANAMAAHQAGPEGQKVPLAASGLQHGFGVDVHLVEDEGQLVDEGNVDVALGVFDHFGGFGHFDAAGFVGAGHDDLVVQGVYQVGNCWRGARGYFLDGGNAVLFVARVDALGAVATEKVFVEGEARELFEHGHAVFFGAARVYGGLINDDVTRFEHLAHRFAGFDEGGKVGLLVLVNGGGHGDDVAVAGAQVVKLGAEAQMGGRCEFFGLGL